MGEPPAVEDPLAAARRALERGEYGRVLNLLEPIAAQHGPATSLGAGVRLLMATALMGQGEGERAAACCRALQGSSDAALRARARELLEVLEAPVLRRPRDWSLTLPELGNDGGFEAVGRAGVRRRRSGPPASPPPAPVGTTRPPWGFAGVAVLVLVLVLLASLLGGCMEVRTDLSFQGPGRLQVSHVLGSASGRPTPWQQRLAEALLAQGFRPAESGTPGQPPSLELRTAVLPADEAVAALKASLEAAAGLAGLDLPSPNLVFHERNWLVGVRQTLRIELDLEEVPVLPGLQLSWRLLPLTPSAVRRAEPLPVAAEPRIGRTEPAVLWPLTPGRRNRLELTVWRWSPLGLGGLTIGGVLAVVLVLQRLRLRLGFGPPELPA